MYNFTKPHIFKKEILIASSFAFAFLAWGHSASAQTVVKSSAAGKGVYEAVVNEQDGFIYVTSAGSRTQPGGAIYKIHPESLAITDSILMKENPPFGLGINHKTQTLYTTNTRTHSVSAVDIKTGKVIATFNNGKDKSHTREVLVDEDNNLIYISDVGDPSSIWVIDGKTNTYLHSIENTGKTTTGMVLNDRKDKMYITNMDTNEVAVIDLKSHKVEKSFPSGGESPVNLVADGNHIFVANQKSGTITVLDAASGQILKSIPTGDGAIGISYDKKNNRIYSANRQTGTTTVIDAATYAVLADLPTGSHPNNVKVSPQTGAAYVINKAKGGRPVEGQPALPADTNGDTITLIR
ncbi:YncE family protein [Sphingobacterium spiritivorum]|uniref:YncE family protein n=1 Tax=Sphingobacterium spiritivorum TaxID=258 RepID=UPI003DA652AA